MIRLIQRTHLMDPDAGNGAGGGTYVPADITPGQDNQTPTSTQTPDSIQKRFDEMTAQTREMERRFQAQQELNMQLMAQLAKGNQPPQAQAPQAPQFQLPEGMDPSMAQAFKAQQDFFQAQLAQQAKQMEQLMSQNLGQVRMTTEQLQFQQAAQAYPEPVRQLAAQRLAQWRQGGYTGWSPEDALRYAAGELVMSGKLQPPAPAQNQGPTPRPFNQPPMPMAFGAPPPSPVPNQQLPEALPDAVLNKMTPEAQLKYWEDRLAKTGGVDQPIVV